MHVASDRARASGEETSRIEYRIAFDLAAASLTSRPANKVDSRESADGEPPTLLLASSPIFVSEWLRRRAHATTVVAPGTVDNTVYSGAVWAVPQRGTWRRDLAKLDSILDVNGALIVLTAGPLGWLIGARSWLRQRGEPCWPILGLRRSVARLGYEIDATYSIGGRGAVQWALSRRLASTLGREDLADRFEAGYRLALGPSRQWRFSLVSLIVAHRTPRKVEAT